MSFYSIENSAAPSSETITSAVAAAVLPPLERLTATVSSDPGGSLIVVGESGSISIHGYELSSDAGSTYRWQISLNNEGGVTPLRPVRTLVAGEVVVAPPTPYSLMEAGSGRAIGMLVDGIVNVVVWYRRT